jgi:hypothetical protein
MTNPDHDPCRMPAKGMYAYADRRFASNMTEYVDVVRASHTVAGDQNNTFSKGILEFLARLYARL